MGWKLEIIEEAQISFLDENRRELIANSKIDSAIKELAFKADFLASNTVKIRDDRLESFSFIHCDGTVLTTILAPENLNIIETYWMGKLINEINIRYDPLVRKIKQLFGDTVGNLSEPNSEPNIVIELADTLSFNEPEFSAIYNLSIEKFPDLADIKPDFIITSLITIRREELVAQTYINTETPRLTTFLPVVDTYSDEAIDIFKKECVEIINTLCRKKLSELKTLKESLLNEGEKQCQEIG